MRNSQDTRPVAPTSTGQFRIPGLGVSTLPLPPAPNAAATAAAAGAALAQHPALANLSHADLTALLGQLQSGQNLLQPLAQAQPSSAESGAGHSNSAGSQAQYSSISHDTVTRGGSSGNNTHSAGDSSLEEGEVSDASMDLDSPVASRPLPSVALKRKHDVADTNGNRKAPRMSKAEDAEDDWLAQAMSYREQVLPFILSLHHEGFSFFDILREVQNDRVLQSIYTELDLPIGKPPSTQPVVANPSLKTNEQAVYQATPAIDRTATTTAAGKNSPKAAAPVDRNEYLARLSQLKAAKSANAVSKDLPKAKPVVPQPSVQPQIAAAKSTVVLETPVQVVKEQEAAQTKKLNTERLKQKLEMLKAAEQKKRELAAAQVAASTPREVSETKQTDVSQSFPASVESGSVRKRPVASDFLNAESETPGFSRPFGQSRQNSDDEAMIIEASDDDSDDADDESNDEPMTSGNDVEVPSILSSARRQRVADFPPLSDFPPRSPFNRQTSTSNVRTPSAQTPGAISEAEALLKHEQELAMLKIRIAEAEKRKKGAASKSGTISDAVTGEMLQDISSAVQKQAQAVATGTSSGNVTPLATSELGSFIDSDKRTMLRAKLSARDIAANAKKARLAEMQRQVELLQKEYEQDMLEQEQLREELEAFNIDTEGMSKEEMEAKKDEIVQQLESQTEPAELHSVPGTQPLEPITSSRLTDSGDAAEQITEPDVQQVVSASASEAAPALPGPNHDNSREEIDVAGEHTGRQGQSIHERDENTSSSSETNTSREDESEGEVAMEDVQPISSDGSGPKEYARSNQEVNGNVTDDEEADMDIEDSSDEFDDESSSSSSESDEADSSGADGEDESRAIPADDEDDNGAEVEESDGDAPMDVSEGDSDNDLDDEQNVEPHEASASSKEPSAMSTSVHSTKVSTPIPADDIAPELQYIEHPAERPSLPAIRGAPFVPYQGSVLQHFRQYRAHPEYIHEVHGGYRSLRYSNNIDAHKMLCPNQGSDEICQDPTCPFQHYRDMSLSDDKILLQLSRPPVRPNQTPEDDQRFRDGLRVVVSELRAKGLTQLDDIAKRMTQYRREFLNNYSLGYDQHAYVPTDA